jgi:hypothetical protein
MTDQTTPTNSSSLLTAKSFLRLVDKSDSPEHLVRSQPAQTLYMSLREEGLDGGISILELATQEQFKLILDFDLWSKDELCEEHLWQWLSVTDASGDLELLQKVLKTIDLKVISMLIGKYVHIITFDEATDAPPSPQYTTPDRGRTWLLIQTEDEQKYFLLGRLLALLFETSAELFYQLIGVSAQNSFAMLEEEAFMDRQRRMHSEGIPDPEFAHKIHLPLFKVDLLNLLGAKTRLYNLSEIMPIEPLTSSGSEVPPPLSTLLDHRPSDADLSEITLIMNAAIIRWGIDFSDKEETEKLFDKVRGSINIGLSLCLEKTTAKDAVARLGYTPLYRAGLTQIGDLRTRARKFFSPHQSFSTEYELLRTALFEPFPSIPEALSSSGEFISVDGKISPLLRPFEYVEQIHLVRRLLEG